MFSIGQKVVCIGENWEFYEELLPRITLPIKDAVYTIRDIRPSMYGSDYLGLLLEEITNPIMAEGPFMLEPSLDATSFRPLVEQKTDISIFQKITDKVFKREKLDA